MSVMFEVYYRPPTDPGRETALTELASRFGGRLDDREDATAHTGVILTYEFDTWDAAGEAAEAFVARGEHVEGPSEYGD